MSHSFFTLGIDAGGTKTACRLVAADGQTWSQRAGPASLTNNPQEACETISGCVAALLEKAGATVSDTVVVIGIAGAGHPDRVARLQASLPAPWRQIEITSDARTSLYGASAGEPAVVLALGTGSVAMRLDAAGEHQFGGWGFTVDDQGSGADIGRRSVNRTLRELDRFGRPASALGRHICASIGNNRPAALDWLGRAGPRDFAGFASWVLENADNCPEARAVTREAADAVLALANTALAAGDLPLYLVGGIARAIMPYLDASLLGRLREPRGDSLDGACLLARRMAMNLD